jgi:hypothetical protein
MRTGGFEDMVQRLAGTYHLTVKDGGGGSGPSDHDSFYTKNIPVMFFFTGLHKQYHQPTDDANLINSEGAMRIARLAADCIDEIDANSQRPQFKADTRTFTLDIQDGFDHEVAPDKAAGGPNRARFRLGLTLKRGQDSGAVVESVVKDSPADQAGIKDNDRITKVGESPVRTARDLISSLRQLNKGEKTKILVERNGVSVELEVTGRQEPPPAKQPFGETGESLIAMAKHLQETPAKPDANRTISWTFDDQSLSVVFRSDNAEDAKEFLDQTVKFIEGVPDHRGFDVKCNINMGFASVPATATEISIKLKKQTAVPDLGKKDASPGDTAKSKDDTGEKTKPQDKPKPDRKPRAGRRRQAA